MQPFSGHNGVTRPPATLPSFLMKESYFQQRRSWAVTHLFGCNSLASRNVNSLCG